MLSRLLKVADACLGAMFFGVAGIFILPTRVLKEIYQGSQPLLQMVYLPFSPMAGFFLGMYRGANAGWFDYQEDSLDDVIRVVSLSPSQRVFASTHHILTQRFESFPSLTDSMSSDDTRPGAPPNSVNDEDSGLSSDETHHVEVFTPPDTPEAHYIARSFS